MVVNETAHGPRVSVDPSKFGAMRQLGATEMDRTLLDFFSKVRPTLLTTYYLLLTSYY